MNLFKRNTYETEASVLESLSCSPSCGLFKMCFLGIALSLIPIAYGIRCLLTRHAILIGHRAIRLDLTGSPAISMAIAYIAVGLFIHAYCFWGLHTKFFLSPILKIIVLFLFTGAYAYNTAYSIIS